MTTEVGRARSFVIAALVGGVVLMLIAIGVAVLTAGPGAPSWPTPVPTSMVLMLGTYGA